MPNFCSRCNAPAKIHLPDTPRCENCFTHYLHRTFKTSIGRLNAGGHRKIAVAISGGESSAAAALLLNDYHHNLLPNPKVASACIVLVHVIDDDGACCVESGVVQSAEHDDIMLSRAPAAVRALHQAVAHSKIIITPVDSAIAEPIHQIRDASDRIDLRRHALYATAAEAARDANCDTLILGTSVTRAASDVLQAVIGGRGTQVRKDASGETLIAGIHLVRPLRGVPIRLLVRYARMKMPNVEFSQPLVGASLQNIVERFVCTVGDDNPSSVHNVVRVAERLEKNLGTSCTVCEHVIDTEGVCKGNGMGTENGCSSCETSECNGSVRLCYGCTGCSERTGAREADNSVLQMANRKSMRKKIEEFLL